MASAVGEVVLDSTGANTTRIVAATGGQTDPIKSEGASNSYAANAYEPGAASVTMSWSVSSPSLWVEHGLPIKPASDGGGFAGVGGLFLGKTGGLIR
jgi:hypothetical protein